MTDAPGKTYRDLTPAEVEALNIEPSVLDPRSFGTKLLDKAKAIPGAVVQGAKNVAAAVKGNPAFNLPEVTSFTGPQAANSALDQKTRSAYAAVNRGLAVARDPEQQIRVIEQSFPGAYIGRGPDGADIVQIAGKKFYVNRPGLSTQDVNSFVPAAAAMVAAATPLGRAGAAVAGPIGAAIGAGVGTTGAELALDAAGGKAAGDFGRDGQRVFNLEHAARTGGIAAAFELVTPPVVDLIIRAARASGTALTPAAEQALKAAGVDTSGLSPETLEAIRRMSANTSDLGAAGRQGRASTLPVPVTLTTGQATRAPTKLALESEGKKGAFGDAAAGALNGVQGEQQRALLENVPAVQQRLNPDGTPIADGQGAARVQETLATDRGNMNRAVGLSYDAARDKGSTWFATDRVREMNVAMRESVVHEHRIADLPRAQGLLDDFNAFAGRDVAGDPAAAAQTHAGTDIVEMERWRTRASNAKNSATLPEEAVAIGKMIRTYDAEIGRKLDEAILSGDETAVKAWRDAVGMRRRFGQIFEADNIVERLTAPAKGGGNALEVGADDAVKLIFGRAAIGSPLGLEQDLSALKKALEGGPDKGKSWNLIREEAFLRLFRLEKGADAGVFPAQSYANNLEDFLKRSPRAAALLFTPEEIGLLRQLKDTALDVAYRPRVVGDVNPSGTAAATFIASKFGFMGNGTRAVIDTMMNGTRNAYRGRQAQTAARGALPPPRNVLAPGAAGAVAGALQQ